MVAKLTCPCNTLQTSNSFARSDTGVVIDSKPHLIAHAKQASCLLTLALPLFRFTLEKKTLIRLHFKYKTFSFPKI